MRFQAYIAVFGSERVVRAINEAVNLAGATSKQYEKVTAQVSPTGLDKPWGWKTARITLSGEPDSGLQKLLLEHRTIFPAISKHREPTTYVSLVLIAQYEEGDEPRGIFLSAETISLIGALGAAFDLDAVRLMQ